MDADIDEKITNFPFPWARETVTHKFDSNSLKKFLINFGVYNQGLWKLESDLQSFKCEFGDLYSNDYVLPGESILLDSTPQRPSSAISSWEEYYKWRGFRPDSPVAVLLQWSLTCYHIINKHLNSIEKSFDSLSLTISSSDSKKMIIHIVGAEKEACLCATYMELQYLLPDVSFDIYFVGSQISKSLHGKSTSRGRLTVTLCNGCYHNSFAGLPRPNIVIGYNAGLPAYTEWIDTIDLLQRERIPAYFTEFSYDSYQYTKIQFDKFVRERLAQQSSNPTSSRACSVSTFRVSEATINPFRSPLRIWSQDSNDYNFSNALLFHLEYYP